uniref:Uncharacterized protein n=1 Tax=Anguilla anguilla TaxID=7936 RepID=A0A0E9TJS4_ANGAN
MTLQVSLVFWHPLCTHIDSPLVIYHDI